MHPEEIKAALRMRGVTSAQIADALDVKPQTVSSVIHGRGTSARIANRIADIIGKPVHDIWEPQPTLRRTPEEIRRSA